MSIDVEVLCEAYATLKAYIPAKDRQEAVDALFGVLVEYLGDDDLKEFGSTDKFTKASVAEHIEEDDDYDEYED